MSSRLNGRRLVPPGERLSRAIPASTALRRFLTSISIDFSGHVIKLHVAPTQLLLANVLTSFLSWIYFLSSFDGGRNR